MTASQIIYSWIGQIALNLHALIGHRTRSLNIFDAMDVDIFPLDTGDLCCPFPETCYNQTVQIVPSLLFDCPAKGYAIFSMAAPQRRGRFIICHLKTAESLSLYICLVQSDELQYRN